MKNRLVLLCLLLAINARGQQDKIVIRFLDAGTEAPMNHVTVVNKAGEPIAQCDSAGYCTLPFGTLNGNDYLLALCQGYEPDTLRSPTATVYLHVLQVSMNAAVINGNKISRLLNEPDEYVVDYVVMGERILVAAYSGNSGNRAKLLLVNKDGEEIARCKVPDEPVQLYMSCTGNYYCVCKGRFFLLSVSRDAVLLKTPYNLKLLAGLQQCEQSAKGNLYYKLTDRTSFKVRYGMIARGDSTFRPLTEFEEKTVAKASWQEYAEIMALIDAAQYNEAHRRAMLRQMWDDGSFAHINMPLFTTGDSLVIFDFFKKRLIYYSLNGQPLGSHGIGFEWRHSQRFEIIKDEPQNQFYIHRYDNQGRQTIEGLDLNTGMATAKKMVVGKPFAEDVKVYNGELYYLWKDRWHNAPRQLYVQREDVSAALSVKER